MNGFEVLREMRGEERFKEIPVIVHSSRDLSSKERQILSESSALEYSKDTFNKKDGAKGLLRILEQAGAGL
jgi:CheY-like chemotaxis protein